MRRLHTYARNSVEYLSLGHAVLQQSCSRSVPCSHCSFCVWMEQAVPQRQPQQILNISSCKLFTANTNAAMYENAWSLKIHLTLSLFLRYSVHCLLLRFPSVISGLLHSMLQRNESRAKTSPGVAGLLRICANNLIYKITELSRELDTLVKTHRSQG